MALIEGRLRAYNRLPEARAVADPICACLMRVSGVGSIAALIYASGRLH